MKLVSKQHNIRFPQAMPTVFFFFFYCYFLPVFVLAVIAFFKQVVFGTSTLGEFSGSLPRLSVLPVNSFYLALGHGVVDLLQRLVDG
ncbi:MAG: hypothetical protein ABH885_01090 [Candidatus Omnitrophota bacterium]